MRERGTLTFLLYVSTTNCRVGASFFVFFETVGCLMFLSRWTTLSLLGKYFLFNFSHNLSTHKGLFLSKQMLFLGHSTGNSHALTCTTGHEWPTSCVDKARRCLHNNTNRGRMTSFSAQVDIIHFLT